MFNLFPYSALSLLVVAGWAACLAGPAQAQSAQCRLETPPNFPLTVHMPLSGSAEQDVLLTYVCDNPTALTQRPRLQLEYDRVSEMGFGRGNGTGACITLDLRAEQGAMFPVLDVPAQVYCSTGEPALWRELAQLRPMPPRTYGHRYTLRGKRRVTRNFQAIKTGRIQLAISLQGVNADQERVRLPVYLNAQSATCRFSSDEFVINLGTITVAELPRTTSPQGILYDCDVAGTIQAHITSPTRFANASGDGMARGVAATLWLQHQGESIRTIEVPRNGAHAALLMPEESLSGTLRYWVRVDAAPETGAFAAGRIDIAAVVALAYP